MILWMLTSNRVPDGRSSSSASVVATEGEQLRNNATVIAYELAEKINAELGKATAWGLSVPLFVEEA